MGWAREKDLNRNLNLNHDAGKVVVLIMVIISDGSSEHSAQICNKSSISICWSHLFTTERVVKSKEEEKSEKTYLHIYHMCATCSEQPSNIKTMGFNMHDASN